MIYFTIKVIFLVTARGKCEARKSTIEKTIPAFAAISLIYWQIKQPADLVAHFNANAECSDQTFFNRVLIISTCEDTFFKFQTFCNNDKVLGRI